MESICKVHAPSKHTAVTPFDLDIIVLVPSSFRNNDGILPSASRLRTLREEQQVLSSATQSLRDPEIHSQTKTIHRQSVLLRLKGDIYGSKCRIQEFLNRSGNHPDLRSHPVLGLLHLSQATNCAYNFDFGQAYEESLKWKPPDQTQLYVDVVWDQVYTAGRLLKGQGYFNEAKLFFERCLTIDGLCESKRILIKSNLADLFSELDYVQRKGSNSTDCVAFLDKAMEIVGPEIERLRARGQHSKGFRRLLLALIEVQIRRHRNYDAEILITEILGIYSRLTEPDTIDRLGHVRALIARARISPLPEAEVEQKVQLS